MGAPAILLRVLPPVTGPTSDGQYWPADIIFPDQNPHRRCMMVLPERIQFCNKILCCPCRQFSFIRAGNFLCIERAETFALSTHWSSVILLCFQSLSSSRLSGLECKLRLLRDYRSNIAFIVKAFSPVKGAPDGVTARNISLDRVRDLV